MKKAKGAKQVSKKNNKKSNFKLLLFIIVPLIIIASCLAIIYTNSSGYKLSKKGYDGETIKIIEEKELTKNALKYDNPKEFSIFCKNNDFKISNINRYKDLSDYIEKFDVVSFANKIIDIERYNENYLINYANKYSGKIEDIENLVKEENKIPEFKKLEKYLIEHNYKSESDTTDNNWIYEKEFYDAQSKIKLDDSVINSGLFMISSGYKDKDGYVNKIYYPIKDEVVVVFGGNDDSFKGIYSKNYNTLDVSCSAYPTFINCDAYPTIAASYREEWLKIFKEYNIDIEIIRQ